ncbi:helix-turn-helix domain-containing protein [Eubacterium sp. 1001713B170207_170306_E7]|uniref:helix-turn-helix domain-containing protein n=1 Tax=Eubacterium sp. 1001713B170207_170306_E7 TaxID=2787097 RepID=UPI00189A17C9|nr:helix-turn-helix domain-containing protein [Eubacterium sp. 1001713B170207_170306_E7]
MKINEVIKEIRTALGLSQVAFAEKLHVSFSTVNRWENGRAVPNRLATITIISLAKENDVDKTLIDFLS